MIALLLLILKNGNLTEQFTYVFATDSFTAKNCTVVSLERDSVREKKMKKNVYLLKKKTTTI